MYHVFIFSIETKSLSLSLPFCLHLSSFIIFLFLFSIIFFISINIYYFQADGVGTLSALEHLVLGLASRTTDVVVKVRTYTSHP